MTSKPDYKNEILALLAQRAPGKSICRSEVLPLEQKKDKALMEKVRESAILLADQGIISITQKGVEVDPHNFKGPIRLVKKAPGDF